MTNIFWPEFSLLFTAALIGGAALIPYSFQLLKLSSKNKPLKMTMPRLVLLMLLQTAVLFAITIGIGLLAAHSVGLGAPYVEAIVADKGVPAVTPMLMSAVTLGVLGGLFLQSMDLIFLPYLPKPLIDMARTTSLWQKFAASFYGGINEEILMRLFGMSAFAWLMSRIWQTPAGAPTDAVFWIANLELIPKPQKAQYIKASNRGFGMSSKA